MRKKRPKRYMIFFGGLHPNEVSSNETRPSSNRGITILPLFFRISRSRGNTQDLVMLVCLFSLAVFVFSEWVRYNIGYE